MKHTQNNIGDKIRKYRKRAGMSQMALEMEIGGSHGMISRIENGAVNPSKESILKISESLNLTDFQTGDLLGLNDIAPLELLHFINEISRLDDIEQILTLSVNRIADIMGYRLVLMSFIEQNYLVAKYRNHNEGSTHAMQMLVKRTEPKVLMSETENYSVRSILDKKSYESQDIAHFGVGLSQDNIVKRMQKRTQMKCLVAIPLYVSSVDIGSINIGRDDIVTFKNEIYILEEISRILSQVIYNTVIRNEK